MLYLVQYRIQHHAGSRVLPAAGQIDSNIILSQIGKPSRVALAVPVKIHAQLPQLRVGPEQFREIQGRGQGNIHMPSFAHPHALLLQPYPAGIDDRLPLAIRRVRVGQAVVVVIQEGLRLLANDRERNIRILAVKCPPVVRGGLDLRRFISYILFPRM